jgi:hypothetical protein
MSGSLDVVCGESGFLFHVQDLGILDGGGIITSFGNRPTIISCSPLDLTGSGTLSVLGTVSGCTGGSFDYEITE